MSASIDGSLVTPVINNGSIGAIGQEQPARNVGHKNYKGFVAGVFSGIAKLSGERSPSCCFGNSLTFSHRSWAPVSSTKFLPEVYLLMMLALTPSKSAYRLPRNPNSKDRLIAFYRQYERRVLEVYTKARRRHWWDGCSWTPCMTVDMMLKWRLI